MQPADSPSPALRPARIAIMDSGLGGLTVFAEMQKALPHAELLYFADDEAFPYGAMRDDALIARVLCVVGRIISDHQPDIVVLACNTASTLCLPSLRERFNTPFVGTVPAIKPAAQQSHSRCISVLATPGTIARDYTAELIATHAADCHVTKVASPLLATYAEAELRGEPVSDAELAAAIAPAFIEEGDARTDTIVLACTHYPLLLPRMRALAPWPVTWIDPAPAIARRAATLLGERPQHPAPQHSASFTSGKTPPLKLQRSLQNFAIVAITSLTIPKN
jgi:glutamate racemase